ncbi:E3 ubiquitin-protein ligase MARCH5 [Penaeus vannamei]|uniref:E3 ubiquitin-protein ligase MARCH5 n=1 Tax=Penaeus vannamei TaxID=6689 RepID=A0A423U5F2_PENVA|nr:E3 ubiquitin-protein ligase MARCH5 [Penaeus vannamei]
MKPRKLFIRVTSVRGHLCGPEGGLVSQVCRLYGVAISVGSGMVGGSSSFAVGVADQNALDYGPPTRQPVSSPAHHSTPAHVASPAPSSQQDLSHVASETLGEALYTSIRTFYENNSNCSGRASASTGTCFCLVQYEGDTCRDPNLAYFISFATVFYLIAAVSLAQLVVCVRSEYTKLKTPSLRRACRVTTQKMLYVITFVAATLRGAYFSSPGQHGPQHRALLHECFLPHHPHSGFTHRLLLGRGE